MCVGLQIPLAEAKQDFTVIFQQNINQRIRIRKWHDWDNDLFDIITRQFIEESSRISHTKRLLDKAPSAVSQRQ
jgi:hypothetical protein